MSFKKILQVFRSLAFTFYFNFHYLPLRQAVRLPILLYKPKLLKMKGKVIIENEFIKTGMIKLGFPTVSLYPNSGIIIENHGGLMIFKGHTSIGNASAISIGKKGKVIFGDYFSATCAFKLTTYCSINFSSHVLCGWECTFTDTDFHKITDKIKGDKYKYPFAPIVIGSNTWIGMHSTILKGTNLPDYVIIGANSLLNSSSICPSYSLMTGIPAKITLSGV